MREPLARGVVGHDAATARLNSLARTRADGRPQPVNLGIPLVTDTPSTTGEQPAADR
ncbi:hypothetical protein [Kitasatospora sp. NPDC056181]|uniref:hypothetical protein n=1 Tax=Kitasatospora sp. NPDC056181 TaxID=3345737 RepID=UPI0035DFEAFD